MSVDQHVDLENVKMELELLMHCVIPIEKGVLLQERPASVLEGLAHRTQEQSQLVQDILELMEIVKVHQRQQDHVHQNYVMLIVQQMHLLTQVMINVQ